MATLMRFMRHIQGKVRDNLPHLNAAYMSMAFG